MGSIAPREVVTRDGARVAIRTASPDDAAALLAHMRVLLEEPGQNILEPDEFDKTAEQMRASMRDHEDKPGMLAIVAESSGVLIGRLFFKNDPQRRLSHRGTFAMSVAADWRRQKIGTELLVALIEWAEASPLIEKVGLGVISTNGPAIELYQKLGFQEEGRCPKEIKFGDSQYADDILMYRFV